MPRLLAALAFLAALTFALAPFVVTPFAGFDPDRFPVRVETPPITPAGYAFSIWGLIYLWLIVGTGFGLLRRADAAGWSAHRPTLLVSLAVGTIWLPVANASPVWSTVLIWVMLATALVAMARAPATEAAFARLPIGLYAGWLTAASFVALGTLAMGYGLADPMPVSWIALLAAVALAAIVTLRGAPPTYPLAAAWGAAGIVVTNWPEAQAFAIASAAGALALLGLTLRSALRKAKTA